MALSYQDKNKRIAIIGAGPAGVFCAIVLSDLFREYNFKKYSITIFDKDIPLKTLLPTGNGRCNITNSIPDFKEFASNYPRGEKFLYSIFSRFSNIDTIEYFEKLGIKTYVQDDNRVFPVSNSSSNVRNILLKHLSSDKNIFFKKQNISSIKSLSNFGYIIVSSGARGTEDLIKSLNHNHVPFKKSLCPLIIKDFDFPQGVSVKSLDGDFLFTKNGVSGPLVFKISSINALKSFPYDIKIKLFDEKLLFEDIKKYPKKSVGTVVSKYIPKSLARVIIKNFSKNISEVSKNELLSYSTLNLTVLSCEEKGEITHAGGIDLKQIDKNCKSKLMKNLWFCGEILNIDGFCGGFNLQNCWSTAYVVAKNVVESIMENNT